MNLQIDKLLSLGAIVLILLVTGCSKSNEQAFHQRKYMPWFQKHKAVKPIVRSIEQEATTSAIASVVTAEPKPTAIESTDLPKASDAVAIEGTAEQPMKTRLSANATAQTKTEKQPQKSQRKAVRKLLERAPQQLEKQQVQSVQPLSNAPASESASDDGVKLILLIIIAILLPPLAVAIVDGIGLSFLLSVVLTILAWIPGIIYALYRVLRG